MRRLWNILPLSALLLSGCTVGPKYMKPPVAIPPAYTESTPTAYKESAEWRASAPSDQKLKGSWWEIFGDSQLNELETSVAQSNFDLKVAEAHLRQARAAIRFNKASQYPSLSLSPSIINERLSANQPYFNPAFANNGTGAFTFPLELSYEVDLWGRIRRSVSAAKEGAQATAADLETAKLSLQAEMARDYFGLRAADRQEQLLSDTVKAYERAYDLTLRRHQGGAAPLSDVEQAKTQLDAARVQQTDVLQTRARYEHAIAVLMGRPPEEFKLADLPGFELKPPVVPVSVPGALLERRPDISSAERLVAQANDQIGIARAAYFPSVVLGATGGFEGTSASNWFNWPSRLWAVGPQFSQTIFDGGRRKANTEAAKANYDATVATYRQTTITAFQEVEDNLAALSTLEKESAQQRNATASSESALRLFNRRYQGGVDTYLQVVSAQTTALLNERNEIEISRERIDATILLIKALGGGWDVSQLPKY